MEPVTFSIATIASLIAWRSTPVQALIIYFAATLLYPQYLTVKIGVVDFNTGRILILVLFAKLLLQTRLLKELRWTRLDSLVLAVVILDVLALVANAPIMLILEREGGVFVSVILPYFVTRATITTKQEFRVLVQGLVCIGVVLAILGAYQSVTGHNPMGFMQNYNAWDPGMQRVSNRFGLYRADVSFGLHIAFGLYFSAMLPLFLTLHRKETNPLRTLAVLMVLFLGLVSSMSTAPFLAFVVSGLFIAFYPFRQYSLIVIALVIASTLFLEFYSNRHFYEVATRFALDGATAAYRIGLFREAFGGGMDGHWLFGYGYVGIGPGTDNSNFHWEYKDLVNMYISRLARFGLLGAIPFVMMNVTYYWCLYRAWITCKSLEDRWMVWCLSAALIGWNIALMTCSLASQIELLLYVLTALAGCMPRLVAGSSEQEEDRFIHESSFIRRRDGGVPGGVN